MSDGKETEMTGAMFGFILWSIVGCLMIGLGVYSFFSKRPMGFWANIKTFQVTDFKGYNAAMGKLFCGFGAVFILLGLPLLTGQNSPWIIVSVLGILAEAIAAMVIYTVVIEKKYRS